MKPNNFQDAIDEIRQGKEAFDEALEKEEAKDEEAAEDNQPSKVLMTGISETIIDILQDPSINSYFKIISDAFGGTDEEKHKATQALVTCMAITMTYGAYRSITLYDEMLRDNLIQQFDSQISAMNHLKSDHAAHQAVVKLHSQKLKTIMDKLKIDEFVKENPDVKPE